MPKMRRRQKEQHVRKQRCERYHSTFEGLKINAGECERGKANESTRGQHTKGLAYHISEPGLYLVSKWNPIEGF